MTTVPVDDPANPCLDDYVGLTDVARRRRVEPSAAGGVGLFIAEGEIVVRRALRAGYRPRSLLLLDSRVGGLGDLIAAAGVPAYVAPMPVLEAVTGFHVHRGVLASFLRRPPRTVAGLLSGSRRLLVCEGLASTTNLGAIFRSAAGLGMDGVLLDPACADPLYRRAVRVSMGEVFALPYARCERWPAPLADLRAAGFRVLALTPAADAVPLEELRPGQEDRLALLLGAEGAGLTEAALGAADLRVRIPMAHGVDSLNVAAAAAVACYALGRRQE